VKNGRRRKKNHGMKAKKERKDGKVNNVLIWSLYSNEKQKKRKSKERKSKCRKKKITSR